MRAYSAAKFGTLLALSLLAACRRGDDPRPTKPSDCDPELGCSEASRCDPLVPDVCALPWPSSAFETTDAGTATGARLALQEDTLPRNRDGVQTRPDMFARKDGFSTVGPVVTFFDGIAADGLIGHDDPDAANAPDATTAIVDLQTGERVPHFAEIDQTTDVPGERLLILRPLVPLAHGRRYVVGYRNLVRADGSPVVPSDAFTALRDEGDIDDPDLAARRDRFESVIFPALAAAGFERSELQLAFDFVTVSQQASLDPVVAMRDDALARTADGPAYVIDTVEDGDCTVEGEHIARTVYGSFTSPRYTDRDQPPAFLVRDDEGVPVYQADTEVPFMVRIPCSLAADPGAGGQLVQYGHGLFGSYDEARAGYLSALADENRYVIFAQDWTGMATLDAATIALTLALDVSDFVSLPDRTTQGFTEWVVGARLAVGPLAADPSLSFGGASVVDPALGVAYYGNSQGAILGGAYVALSPDIERAVLGVGGMPYSLLLSRSADFDPFFLLFQQKFTDHRDIALLLAAFQTVWDPAESGGYAHVMAGGLPGTPDKRYLMQVAIGDAQVTTLGAHIAARALDAPTLAPAVRPIWGVPEDPGPVEGSAIIEWYYDDGALEPFDNVPPDSDGDTHECPRREPAAQEQLVTFLRTGTVEQTCTGTCTGTRAGFCD